MSLIEKPVLLCVQTTKALISLCNCTGWSEPLLSELDFYGPKAFYGPLMALVMHWERLSVITCPWHWHWSTHLNYSWTNSVTNRVWYFWCCITISVFLFLGVGRDIAYYFWSWSISFSIDMSISLPWLCCTSWTNEQILSKFEGLYLLG